eukprot:scaffold13704_cov42-Phaeocystis_antarctica.AAC.1
MVMVMVRVRVRVRVRIRVRVRDRVRVRVRVRVGDVVDARDQSVLVELLMPHAVAHVQHDRAAQQQRLELVGVTDAG